VRLSTTAALAANTRTDETLTANGVGALSIDGTAVVVGDRVLVKNEGGVASHINNGIYVIDVIGDGATAWSMTRATSADSSLELTNGLTVQIGPDGDTLDDQYWQLITPDPITLHTTPIAFQSMKDTLGYTDTGAAKVGAYNAVIDDMIEVNPTGGGFAITLPTAVGFKNRGITIKNVTASVNAVTFTTTGGQTIDALASGADSIAAAYGAITVISNGVGWNRFPPV
ncbi:unnamed protein product, partial [marine sediment metagenome]